MNDLRRMVQFLRPYGWLIAIALFTVVLPVAMELVVPRMLQYVIDQGIRPGDFAAIWWGSIVMLVSALIGVLATLGQGVYRALLSQGIAHDLRATLFTHVQALSFANLDRLQTGELVTRLSSDVNVVRLFTSAGLALMLRALLMIVGSVVMLVITDAKLATIMFVMIGVAAVIIRQLMHRARPLFERVQQKLSTLNTLVQENLAGVQVVRSFVREPYEVDRFGDSNVDYMEQNIRVGRLLAMAMPSLTIITNLGIVGVIWWGGMDVIGGRLTVGELVAFSNYLMIGMAPLLLLSNMLTMVSRADASAARIWEVLDTGPSIVPAKEGHKPAKVEGRIEFDHVAYWYDGQDGVEYTNGTQDVARDAPRAVLDGVTFMAEKGQRVALLGATGSGKSTLVHLIPRFYEVNAGAIRVDGVDIREWDLRTLRANIGVVLQETTLFSGTVRENIAYGRPSATDEEVVAAARAAEAHDFIMRMPGGYESHIEARGANLSGGQKQRMAIARALLVKPPILILDDSTSSVDMDTEFRIQEALEGLLTNCTTLIVAQRISSVINADRIIILESGRIVANGTHQELLTTSPIYQDICRSQLGTDPLGAVPVGASPAD